MAKWRKMMNSNTQNCPICGDSRESKIDSDNPKYHIFSCDEIGTKFHLSRDVYDCDEKDFRKRCNMICAYLLEKPYKKIDGEDCCCKFYYDEQKNDDPIFINVFELMKDYPKNVGEKLDRIIVNISRKFSDIGNSFVFNSLPDSLIFMETDDISEKYTLGNYLKDRNLISPYNEGHDNHQDYKLTAKAWELVAEQTKKQKEINQGFIAMEISDKTKIIHEYFKTAIDACGYKSRRIDEKEHNNQIVPEIFYEIGQSKFVVVDVTYPNYGAYYEAGYAQALGKQVIICCRKNESECIAQKPHFDISQKNMIFWNDKEELIKSLKKRIEATIGLNK